MTKYEIAFEVFNEFLNDKDTKAWNFHQWIEGKVKSEKQKPYPHNGIENGAMPSVPKCNCGEELIVKEIKEQSYIHTPIGHNLTLLKYYVCSKCGLMYDINRR